MAKKNQSTTCSALSWDDFLFLLDVLKRQKEYALLMVVATGGYLGLRISDIRLIRWGDLLGKNNFEVIEQKTNKRRFIMLNQAYRDLVEFVYKQKSNSPGDFIAANKSGQAMSIQYLNRMLHRVFSENNISAGNGSSHTMRKTFGRRFWTLNNKSEASLILLSKVFNHSSVAITREYLGITIDEINDVYLSL